LDNEGNVHLFDRLRTTPGLQGVEISYAILTEPVLDLLPLHDTLFEEAIYTPLARQGRLAAYLTEHRYYSVGSRERLPSTEAFLRRERTIILDRDGVLNRKPPKAQYVRNWGEWEWLPGALESLRLFREAGWRVIVVSNQAGVGRGFMTEADVHDIHVRMQAAAKEAGGNIEAVYFCPHDWHDECECRKPKPGMLFRAQKDFHLDLSRTPFIGDDGRDAAAAEAAECSFELVGETRSLLDITRQLLNGQNTNA
jgi:D-glycero-D-manno-heptose 1,7-bisphosphate phosphatase